MRLGKKQKHTHTHTHTGYFLPKQDTASAVIVKERDSIILLSSEVLVFTEESAALQGAGMWREKTF